MNLCTTCNKECDGKWIDVGIGPYEFWGQKCTDKDVQYLSECCEAEVIDEDGATVTGDGYDEG